MLYSCHFFCNIHYYVLGFLVMVFILILRFCLSQIESKSGTVVLRWVNGQLERIETWVKRAAEQEVNTLIAKKTFLLYMTLFASLYKHFTGDDKCILFYCTCYILFPCDMSCFLTLLLYSSIVINFLQDFIHAKFMLDRFGILYHLNNAMGVL